ncbi:MAG: hypothetical protein K8S54_21395 [Spirochaetia bacterium]|nr:hypothetical protein [Spirochaetia bacterium]
MKKIVLSVLVAMLVGCAPAAKKESTLGTKLAPIQTSLAAGDFTAAATGFDQFHDAWELVEDALRAKSPEAYRAIEDAMDDLKASIKRKDAAKAGERFKALQELIQKNGL